MAPFGAQPGWTAIRFFSWTMAPHRQRLRCFPTRTHHSAAGDLNYQEGRDFEVDREAGVIARTVASRIPVTTLDELYTRADPDGSAFMFRRNAPGTYLMFSEGDLFHRRQVRASYTHAAGRSRRPSPRFDAAALPRLLRLFRARAPISIAVAGDSISEGYNASGFLAVPPFQPAYVDRVVAGLHTAFGSPIMLPQSRRPPDGPPTRGWPMRRASARWPRTW